MSSMEVDIFYMLDRGCNFFRMQGGGSNFLDLATKFSRLLHTNIKWLLPK